jgi:hypothetical protein
MPTRSVKKKMVRSVTEILPAPSDDDEYWQIDSR